jgi:NTE family protein
MRRGLVLSSGGGLAVGIQLGMLDELFIAMPEMSFDFVAGTSGGGWVAAVYADSPNHSSIRNAIGVYLHLTPKEVFGTFYWLTAPIKDILWRINQNSVRGFLSQKKYMRFLKDYFGNARMIDLAAECAIVGHDINQHQAIVFSNALQNIDFGHNIKFIDDYVYRAVYVTSAQPPYIPPLLVNGDNWMDGGVTNSLPVDLARAANVDEMWVFAVNSSNRSATEIRGLGDIIQESVDSAVGFNLKLALESLEDPNGIPSHVIYGDNFPDVGGFLDFFDKSEELVEYGRRVMRNYLDNPTKTFLRKI